MTFSLRHPTLRRAKWLWFFRPTKWNPGYMLCIGPFRVEWGDGSSD
jgi:hypothetical protein